MRSRIIIIGGGAAGLTSAIFASKLASTHVHILERSTECGKKILMSGGTRCNVIPYHVTPGDFTTSSKKTTINSIFNQFKLDDVHNWMTKEIGLKLKGEEETNKWFPENESAKEVRDLLLKKALELGVKLTCEEKVVDVNYINNIYIVITEKNVYECDSLIISTGGLSYPTIGTDGIGHTIAKKLGHSITPLYPALTPLVGSHPSGKNLAGVSVNVGIKIKSQTGKIIQNSKRSGFLFTHSGYSGPAILDVSHYAVKYLENEKENEKVFFDVNWNDQMSEMDWEEIFLNKSIKLVSNVIRIQGIPHRLADALCEEVGIPSTSVATLTKIQRKEIINSLTNYRLPIIGHKGYRLAEVTGGGIPLNEIKLNTMESIISPKLYFCGEILDPFGRIGGFNFYWAWVTGKISGSAVS